MEAGSTGLGPSRRRVLGAGAGTMAAAIAFGAATASPAAATDPDINLLGFFNVQDPAYNPSGTATTEVIIAAAISAAHAAGGGVVWFPPGEYTIGPISSSPVKVGIYLMYSNITLLGAGSGATVLSMGEANMIGVGAGSLTNLRVEGMTIKQTHEPDTPSLHGIAMQSVANWSATDVEILGFEGNGITPYECSVGTVERCTITDCGQSAVAIADSDRTSLINNRMAGATDAGAPLVTVSGSHDISLVDNDLRSGVSNQPALKVSDSDGVNVFDNSLVSVSSPSTSIVAVTSTDPGSSVVTIESNTFRGSTTNLPGAVSCDANTDAAITGNRVIGAQSLGATRDIMLAGVTDFWVPAVGSSPDQTFPPIAKYGGWEFSITSDHSQPQLAFTAMLPADWRRFRVLVTWVPFGGSSPDLSASWYVKWGVYASGEWPGNTPSIEELGIASGTAAAPTGDLIASPVMDGSDVAVADTAAFTGDRDVLIGTAFPKWLYLRVYRMQPTDSSPADPTAATDVEIAMLGGLHVIRDA